MAHDDGGTGSAACRIGADLRELVARYNQQVTELMVTMRTMHHSLDKEEQHGMNSLRQQFYHQALQLIPHGENGGEQGLPSGQGANSADLAAVLGLTSLLPIAGVQANLLDTLGGDQVAQPVPAAMGMMDAPAAMGMMDAKLSWEDETSRMPKLWMKDNNGEPMSKDAKIHNKRKRNHQNCDKPKWRKYGQKQVKLSLDDGTSTSAVRCYFKCTIPGCPVKMLRERPVDESKPTDEGADDDSAEEGKWPAKFFGEHNHYIDPATEVAMHEGLQHMPLATLLWRNYMPQKDYDAKDAKEAKKKPKGLAGLNVLVVEDDAPMRAVLQKQLQQQGAQVRVVKDGQELVDLVRHDPETQNYYHMCLLDEFMPNLNGSDALRNMRQTVMMSGSLREPKSEGYAPDTAEDLAEQAMRKRFFSAGAHIIMPKPIRMESLLPLLMKAKELHATFQPPPLQSD